MNSEQAKKLSLPDIMSRLGYEPTEITKGGAEYWYCSPFRKEKEPSFHTSYLGGKWIWNDFADSGGTVIDFVMRHKGDDGFSFFAYDDEDGWLGWGLYCNAFAILL